MTAGPGPRKLAPITLYGLVPKNYSEQFTAWISKGANNPAGSPVTRSHTARLFGLIAEGEKWDALITPLAFTFRGQLSLHT